MEKYLVCRRDNEDGKSRFAGETDMEKFVIKKMESEDEINGKGYVHYKSWHETYTGLIDADYLERQTLEKCIATAHKMAGQYSCSKRWRAGYRFCEIRCLP